MCLDLLVAFLFLSCRLYLSKTHPFEVSPLANYRRSDKQHLLGISDTSFMDVTSHKSIWLECCLLLHLSSSQPRPVILVAHIILLFSSFSFPEEGFAHLSFCWIRGALFQNFPQVEKNTIHHPDPTWNIFRPRTWNQVPSIQQKGLQTVVAKDEWLNNKKILSIFGWIFSENSTTTQQQMSGHYKDIYLWWKKNTLASTNWNWLLSPFCCRFPEIPAA